MFKNWILKHRATLIFFTVLGLSIIVPSLLMTPSFLVKHNLAIGNNAVYTKIRQEKPETIDVFITGDSLSYTSISPLQLWSEYGYTAFDLGIPGANLADTKDILATAFETQTPKVVLLETNGLYRDANSGEYVQSQLASVLYKALPLLRYHNGWKGIFNYGATNATHKGFRISTTEEAYEKGEYMKETKKSKEIDETNIMLLHQIEDMCQEKGSLLLLYSAPSPKCYSYSKHNALTQLASDENLAYIDLNMYTSTLNIDWKKDTRDKGDHLNYYGAKKVTTYMGQILQDSGLMTDMREDETLSDSWDKSFDKYEASINQMELEKNNDEVSA